MAQPSARLARAGRPRPARSRQSTSVRVADCVAEPASALAWFCSAHPVSRAGYPGRGWERALESDDLSGGTRSRRASVCADGQTDGGGVYRCRCRCTRDATPAARRSGSRHGGGHSSEHVSGAASVAIPCQLPAFPRVVHARAQKPRGVSSRSHLAISHQPPPRRHTHRAAALLVPSLTQSPPNTHTHTHSTGLAYT